MLRDALAYDLWLKREEPSEAAQRIASWLISRASATPESAPSVPIDVSDQPHSQVRLMELPVPGEATNLFVMYRCYYDCDDVDLVHIVSERM